MGVVYKAEDTRLKRTVALKFLPPEFTQDQSARERFFHEAEAASALEHADICSVHELGVHDGQMFLVMGFYQGETFRQKIDRGPMPIETILDIAMQTARGLSRAHEAGIIHRDIKPANLIVTTRGDAKILDFGLARLAERTMLTGTGSTFGTAAYMSPEQARAEIREKTLTQQRVFENGGHSRWSIQGWYSGSDVSSGDGSDFDRPCHFYRVQNLTFLPSHNTTRFSCKPRV